MTKRNQKNRLANLQILDTSELAAATGGYTLRVSYDLTGAMSTTQLTTLSNLLEPATETSSSTVTNTK